MGEQQDLAVDWASVDEHARSTTIRLPSPRSGSGASRDRTSSPPSGGESSGTPWWRSDRAALVVFLVYLAVAAVVLLRSYSWLWFSGDDWGLIDGRDISTLEGIFAPHNEHPVAMPAVVYGVLYRIVGLNSFLPYMAAIVAMHLTLALLLRTVMRRAGVGAWMATFVAATFVLFGTGWVNMVNPIELSLVGSLTFGVGQLIVADHDGPIGRRDGLALVLGAVAVLSSSAGVVMVAMVGGAVLLRRGWKPALLQTVPLAAVYLAWRAWASTLAGEAIAEPGAPIRDLIGWVFDLFQAVFVEYAQHPIAGTLVVALLVSGLVLAWARLPWQEFRRVAAAPLALLVGAVVLAGTIASQRAGFDKIVAADLAISSRYLAMALALLLPALAVAADAYVRRWRLSIPVVVILLLVGVPGNLAKLGVGDELFNPDVMQSQRDYVTLVAASPAIGKVPADTRLGANPYLTANLTTGFLEHAREQGRVPDPPADVKPTELEAIEARLRLSQLPMLIHRPDGGCQILSEPLVIEEPHQGDRYYFDSPITIQVQRPDGSFGWPAVYTENMAGNVVEVEADDVALRIGPFKNPTFEWCEL